MPRVVIKKGNDKNFIIDRVKTYRLSRKIFKIHKKRKIQIYFYETIFDVVPYIKALEKYK